MQATIEINQTELQKLIEKYNNIDPTTIKQNLVRHIEQSIYRRNSKALANIVGVDLQTIYLWRQPKKGSNISFESALKVCNVLGISITELIN